MSCQDILNAVFSEQLVIEKMYYKLNNQLSHHKVFQHLNGLRKAINRFQVNLNESTLKDSSQMKGHVDNILTNCEKVGSSILYLFTLGFHLPFVVIIFSSVSRISYECKLLNELYTKVESGKANIVIKSLKSELEKTSSTSINSEKAVGLNQQTENQTNIPAAGLIQEKVVILISDNEDENKNIIPDCNPTVEQSKMAIEETKTIIEGASEKPMFKGMQHLMSKEMQNTVIEPEISMQEEPNPSNLTRSNILQQSVEKESLEVHNERKNLSIKTNAEIILTGGVETAEKLPEAQNTQIEKIKQIYDSTEITAEEEKGIEKKDNTEKFDSKIRRKPPFKATKLGRYKFLFEDGRKVLRRLRNKFKKLEHYS